LPSGDGEKQVIRDSFYENEVFVEIDIVCQPLEDGEWNVAYEHYDKDWGQENGTDGTCDELFHVSILLCF
jgi:hypothetical protein